MTDLNSFFKLIDNHKLSDAGLVVNCKHNRTQTLLNHHYNLTYQKASDAWQSPSISTFKRTAIHLIQSTLGKHYVSTHSSLLKWIKANNDWSNPKKSIQNWKLYQSCVRNHILQDSLHHAPEQQWQDLFENIHVFQSQLSNENAFCDLTITPTLSDYSPSTAPHQHLHIGTTQGIHPSWISTLKSQKIYAQHNVPTTNKYYFTPPPFDLLAEQILSFDSSKTWAIITQKPHQIAQQLSRHLTRKTLDKHCSTSDPQPLSQHPIIQLALQWLKQDETRISTDQFQQYLTHQPLSQRLNLSSSFSLEGRYIDIANINDKGMLAWVKWINLNQHNYDFNEWSTILTDLLTQLKWPLNAQHTSSGYQVIQQWLMIMETLSLEISPKTPQNIFVQCLESLCNHTYFQAQHHEQNICILTPEEAIGVPFDKISLLEYQPVFENLTHLPPSSLPIEPLSTKQLIEQLSLQTPLLMIHPSSLDECTPQPLNTHPHPNQQTLDTESLIEQPIPLTTPKKASSQLIKDQAHCPFRAFAVHRLHAKSPNPTPLHLSPQQRGTILHHIVESLTLQPNQPIEKCIEKSINTYVSDNLKYSIGHNLLELEKIRFKNIIEEWKNHPTLPSSLGARCEMPLHGNMNSLHFSLRLDRVDLIDPYSYRIIDYKTGTINLHEWLDSRLLEPQLPLYALLYPKAKEIGIITLKSNRIRYKGISFLADEIELIGHRSSNPYQLTSQELIRGWRTKINTLIEEFENGLATVTPHPKSNLCQYCHLTSLCRIHDQRNHCYEP
ncbi:MAG TPA: PD-(D/E)XK nuclease family protein [Gammaproteobacteria bacterium]|nr:PD-(D/E)XK nuclease family protein [Gammaproteobacteria bacterium]